MPVAENKVWIWAHRYFVRSELLGDRVSYDQIPVPQFSCLGLRLVESCQHQVVTEVDSLLGLEPEVCDSILNSCKNFLLPNTNAG